MATCAACGYIKADGRSASCAEAHLPTNDELADKWRMLNPDLEPPLELLR